MQGDKVLKVLVGKQTRDSLATVPGRMQPVQCRSFSGPLPQLPTSQSCGTPATAQRHFLRPLFSLALPWETVCPARWKTRQGGGGEGEQTSQQPVPVAGGSLQTEGAALPPTPPSDHPGQCSHVVTGGSACSGMDRGLPPQPAVLGQLEETGGGRASSPLQQQQAARLMAALLGGQLGAREAALLHPTTGKTCFLVF